eukprot:m51a1_g13406 hypothetical protein (314) ;mRNA; f:39875-43853
MSGVRLSRADLAGMDLRKVDMSKADLSDALVSLVDLRGANLTEAELPKSLSKREKVSGANLSGVDLSNRDLSGFDFTGGCAVLRGANLGGVDLSNRDLSGMDLTGTNLTMFRDSHMIGSEDDCALLMQAYQRSSKALFPPVWRLLWRASASGGSMTASEFHRQCDGKGPTFTFIRDTNNSLGACDARGALLGGADLRGACLARADLRGVALCRLARWSLARADLSDARLPASLACRPRRDAAPEALARRAALAAHRDAPEAPGDDPVDIGGEAWEGGWAGADVSGADLSGQAFDEGVDLRCRGRLKLLDSEIT